MSSSEILNILLGGGLVALIVAVATMRATVRKANAEAEKAKADADKARAEAETVRITNTENATRILVENIVKPLKEELHATREKLSATEGLMAGVQKELASTKRALSRLSRAVESATNCRYADDCVVLRKLRDNKKEQNGGNTDIFNIREEGHDIDCDQTDNDRDNSGEPCGDEDIGGQPP